MGLDLGVQYAPLSREGDMKSELAVQRLARSSVIWESRLSDCHGMLLEKLPLMRKTQDDKDFSEYDSESAGVIHLNYVIVSNQLSIPLFTVAFIWLCKALSIKLSSLLPSPCSATLCITSAFKIFYFSYFFNRTDCRSIFSISILP